MLEHRYYGFSHPFTDAEGGLSVENLKWLNTKQALADVANFIETMNKDFHKKPQWVVIGGSYSGTLAAFFKSKYPQHATAAWASSAVVKAIEDF